MRSRLRAAEFAAAEARLDGGAARRDSRGRRQHRDVPSRRSCRTRSPSTRRPACAASASSRPIESVGLYVPAGNAPLPSTALMLGVPARIAGCPTRILCSPVQATGRVDAAVLYAARVAGVQRVFKLGGAQAIAAMAYGTESVPKVDKIFGPGNTWVTEAKAQVDRDPGRRRARLSRRAVRGARDRRRQREPGVRRGGPAVASRARRRFAGAARDDERASSRQAVSARRSTRRRRGSRARKLVDGALAHSSVIVVDDLETAFAISNRYAPEHLILQIEQPRAWLDKVAAAGSVFLGPWTPESVGDYCSGTNHVLPTYGFARRYSSLGVGDFVRSMTVQELTLEGLRNDRPDRDDARRVSRASTRTRGPSTSGSRPRPESARMSTLLDLARPELRGIRPYVPGAYEPGCIRLNANESPWRAPGDDVGARAERLSAAAPDRAAGEARRATTASSSARSS